MKMEFTSTPEGSPSPNPSENLRSTPMPEAEAFLMQECYTGPSDCQAGLAAWTLHAHSGAGYRLKGSTYSTYNKE